MNLPFHHRYKPKWTPVLREDPNDRRQDRPPVGHLIALNRKPYRITGFEEISSGNWTEEDWEEYNRPRGWALQVGRSFPDPDDWEERPCTMLLVAVPTPPGGGEPLSAVIRPYIFRPSGWDLLPEHYAVCASCGELAPCRELEKARAMEVAAVYANQKLERDLSILDGCCWSCGEVITHRQKRIEFEGDNADLPGGPAAVFHLREKCRGDARRYEERWAKLDGSRRSRLSCPGKVIYHLDGMECTEDPHCPGEQAQHNSGMSNHRQGYGICLRCKDAHERNLMS